MFFVAIILVVSFLLYYFRPIKIDPNTVVNIEGLGWQGAEANYNESYEWDYLPEGVQLGYLVNIKSKNNNKTVKSSCIMEKMDINLLAFHRYYCQAVWQSGAFSPTEKNNPDSKFTAIARPTFDILWQEIKDFFQKSTLKDEMVNLQNDWQSIQTLVPFRPVYDNKEENAKGVWRFPDKVQFIGNQRMFVQFGDDGNTHIVLFKFSSNKFSLEKVFKSTTTFSLSEWQDFVGQYGNKNYEITTYSTSVIRNGQNLNFYPVLTKVPENVFVKNYEQKITQQPPTLIDEDNLNLIYPNGGEIFNQNQLITIEYKIGKNFKNQTTSQDLIELYLLNSDNTLVGHIGKVDVGYNKFFWNIENLIHDAGIDSIISPTPAGQYRILILSRHPFCTSEKENCVEGTMDNRLTRYINGYLINSETAKNFDSDYKGDKLLASDVSASLFTIK